jgi:hypothetical protein
MALNRTIRFHEGLGSTYDGARRQMLAKMDDDAYQSFVQSFKFCHECRQFVCSECWSNSRRTCLGCFAKAAWTSVRPKPPFAPEGPAIPRPVALASPAGRKRRLRTDASLLVMGAAILLLVVEVGFFILPNAMNGGGAHPSASGPIAVVSATPTATPTADPSPSADPTASLTPAPTDTPVPTATPIPTASPSPSPSPLPSATPTIRITPKPVPTVKPFPTTVTMKLTGGVGSIRCQWLNYDARRTSITWRVDGVDHAATGATITVTGIAPGFHNVQLIVKYGTKTYYAGPTGVETT